MPTTKIMAVLSVPKQKIYPNPQRIIQDTVTVTFFSVSNSFSIDPFFANIIKRCAHILGVEAEFEFCPSQTIGDMPGEGAQTTELKLFKEQFTLK